MACSTQDIPFLTFPRNEIIEVCVFKPSADIIARRYMKLMACRLSQQVIIMNSRLSRSQTLILRGTLCLDWPRGFTIKLWVIRVEAGASACCIILFGFGYSCVRGLQGNGFHFFLRSFGAGFSCAPCWIVLAKYSAANNTYLGSVGLPEVGQLHAPARL